MKTYNYLKGEKKNGCYLITINKPPANALTIGSCVDLADMVDEAGLDDDIRAIIITGGIPFAFFSGSDLEEILYLMNREEDVKNTMIMASKPVQTAFTRIENSPKVTIAAINGVTIGLGVELAMVCDIRLASDLAWFKLAQTSIGIIPGVGGTQRLPGIIGMGRAKEWILLGKKIKAEEALQSGFVNYVVPHKTLLQKAFGLAETLGKETAPQAVRLAKTALHNSCRDELHTFQERLDDELDLLGEAYNYNDAFEGITARMEKRSPGFNGHKRLPGAAMPGNKKIMEAI